MHKVFSGIAAVAQRLQKYLMPTGNTDLEVGEVVVE